MAITEIPNSHALQTHIHELLFFYNFFFTIYQDFFIPEISTERTNLFLFINLGHRDQSFGCKARTNSQQAPAHHRTETQYGVNLESPTNW